MKTMRIFHVRWPIFLSITASYLRELGTVACDKIMNAFPVLWCMRYSAGYSAVCGWRESYDAMYIDSSKTQTGRREDSVGSDVDSLYGRFRRKVWLNHWIKNFEGLQRRYEP